MYGGLELEKELKDGELGGRQCQAGQSRMESWKVVRLRRSRTNGSDPLNQSWGIVRFSGILSLGFENWNWQEKTPEGWSDCSLGCSASGTLGNKRKNAIDLGASFLSKVEKWMPRRVSMINFQWSLKHPDYNGDNEHPDNIKTMIKVGWLILIDIGSRGTDLNHFWVQNKLSPKNGKKVG